jgi:hypothetical protein
MSGARVRVAIPFMYHPQKWLIQLPWGRPRFRHRDDQTITSRAITATLARVKKAAFWPSAAAMEPAAPNSIQPPLPASVGGQCLSLKFEG